MGAATAPLAATPNPNYVQPGARVRVTIVDSAKVRVVGRLISQTGDSLYLNRDNESDLHIALDRVSIYEVSRERKSNVGRGAGMGFLICAPLGVIAGATCDCGEPELAGILFGLFTGALGAAVGAGVGALGRHDVWENVPELSVGPEQASSVRLAVTWPIRF